MYTVKIKPHWEISAKSGASFDTTTLLALLNAIQENGSITRAAQSSGNSYRHVWGILREAEKMFGHPLIHTERGRGSQLTSVAKKLIWAQHRITARLLPTLDTLSCELEIELNKAVQNQSPLLRLNASHGFAVAALQHQLNAQQLPLELRYRNSTDAVAALAHQECDLAGFHVPLGEFEEAAVKRYSSWLDQQKHCLIHLAVRNQGLIVASGNPNQINNLHDLVRPGITFVNRQTGSGTRTLLELMLAKQGLAPEAIAGYHDTAEFTHSAIAAFIASGMADVGFGVQTAAHRFNLGFIPLIRERYFFALSINMLNNPLLQQVIQTLQSASFRSIIDSLAGYSSDMTGGLFMLPQAFSCIK